nr:hypothetical protein [uncultured Cetobacterium sp.]
MKKIILIGLTALSLATFASDDVIIDKQVTGVNKEQLEVYESNSNINLDKKVIKMEDKNVSADKYKNQKQIIQVSNSDDGLDSNLVEEKSTPIWKYVIGVVALVTLGIAL